MVSRLIKRIPLEELYCNFENLTSLTDDYSYMPEYRIQQAFDYLIELQAQAKNRELQIYVQGVRLAENLLAQSRFHSSAAEIHYALLDSTASEAVKWRVCPTFIHADLLKLTVQVPKLLSDLIFLRKFIAKFCNLQEVHLDRAASPEVAFTSQTIMPFLRNLRGVRELVLNHCNLDANFYRCLLPDLSCLIDSLVILKIYESLAEFNNPLDCVFLRTFKQLRYFGTNTVHRVAMRRTIAYVSQSPFTFNCDFGIYPNVNTIIIRKVAKENFELAVQKDSNRGALDTSNYQKIGSGLDTVELAIAMNYNVKFLRLLQHQFDIPVDRLAASAKVQAVPNGEKLAVKDRVQKARRTLTGATSAYERSFRRPDIGPIQDKINEQLRACQSKSNPEPQVVIQNGNVSPAESLTYSESDESDNSNDDYMDEPELLYTIPSTNQLNPLPTVSPAVQPEPQNLSLREKLILALKRGPNKLAPTSVSKKRQAASDQSADPSPKRVRPLSPDTKSLLYPSEPNAPYPQRSLPVNGHTQTPLSTPAGHASQSDPLPWYHPNYYDSQLSARSAPPTSVQPASLPACRYQPTRQPVANFGLQQSNFSRAPPLLDVLPVNTTQLQFQPSAGQSPNNSQYTSRNDTLLRIGQRLTDQLLSQTYDELDFPLKAFEQKPAR